MINKSPTAPKNRSERKEDLWDLAEHLRSAEGRTGLASEGWCKLSTALGDCETLIRSDWITRFTSQPTPMASEIRRSRTSFFFPLPADSLCLRKPVQLAGAHFTNVGCFFSLCCVKHNDPEHRELTRDLHGLRWREERKGLKRGVNGEDTQKRSEVPGRGSNVLSADLGLFMSDKHPVVRGSSNARTGRKNKHKSIKGSGPACPLHLITVSCVLSCLWPHSCLRDGRFLCFLPSSSFLQW